MRIILPLVFVLPFAFGCGHGSSDSIDDGGHHQGDDDDDGGSPDAGGCGNEVPPIACSAACGQGEVPPQCIDGVWQCAEYGIDCSEDAGVDACSYTVGACGGGELCPGVYQEPVCYGGAWSCQWDGVCEEEAGPPDAWVPPPFDAGPPLFACGALACDPSSSYCQITTGGPVGEDGGSNAYFSCIPLPPSCASGGDTSCACVQAFQGAGGCGCVTENGDVVVTCVVP